MPKRQSHKYQVTDAYFPDGKLVSIEDDCLRLPGASWYLIIWAKLAGGPRGSHEPCRVVFHVVQGLME